MMQSVKSLAAQSELQASPLKLTLFGGISILLRQCNIHWLCYCCMLLVECLQLLYYCLHNRYGFLWQCQLTDGLQFGKHPDLYSSEISRFVRVAAPVSDPVAPFQWNE